MPGFCSVFQKVPHVCVLQHILGTLRSAASCLPRLRNQLVVASFLGYSRLGIDRRQRVSSDFVAQPAATFGVMRNHTDAFVTQQDRGRWQSESARHKQYAQEDVTLLAPFVQFWLVDQAGRVPFTPIYRNPFLLEPSSNIIPETFRIIEKSVELSGLFWIVLDPSRSFYCIAVLAQRAHWYMCRL